MRTKKISLLLALVLVISAIALPLTAYAAGDKDTTPPELAASLDGGTLKVESSDDNSGVEAVFVDGNRINSLTNGAATVTLKDYAGTGKQVNVYAQDYAGNRSKTVKFENPYYEEPTPTEKPAETVQQNQSSKPVKPAQVQAASSGSTNHNAQSSNSGSHSSGNGEPVTYGHSLASNKKPTLKLAFFRSLPSLMQGHYSYHAGACQSACSRYECFWACPHPHICPRSHIQADP